MGDLFALVDFDNLEPALTRLPLATAVQRLVSGIPLNILAQYSDVIVRLYGGWREGPRLTKRAQFLVPELRRDFPRAFTPIGTAAPLQIHADLASGPLCIPNSVLNSTLAHDRALRKFHARPIPWSECAKPGSCGFNQIALLRHDTPCGNGACTAVAGEVLARSEQKMVDTCMAVDMAHIGYVVRARHAVVYSSDVDMWPGILCALSGGTHVVQIHTRAGSVTQGHLLRTIPPPLQAAYNQKTV